MFWVTSVYFNVGNILPKSGTFPPPGTPCIYQVSKNVQFGSLDVLTVAHVLVSGNVTIRLQSVQELVRVAVVR